MGRPSFFINPMNVKLLKQIKNRILAEPTEFDMCRWAASDKVSTCGTTACIAGWALALDFMARHPEMMVQEAHMAVVAIDARPDAYVNDRAADLLEIDDAQMESIFYHSAWPSPWGKQYDKLVTKYDECADCEERVALRRKMAKIAAEFIVHLIETEEKLNPRKDK